MGENSKEGKARSIAVRRALAVEGGEPRVATDGQAIVRFTETQVGYLKSLTSKLGLSQRLALNVAARYATHELQSKASPAEKRRDWPKRLGKLEIEFEPTLETDSRRLDDIDLERLVVFGVKILHRRLFRKK